MQMVETSKKLPAVDGLSALPKIWRDNVVPKYDPESKEIKAFAEEVEERYAIAAFLEPFDQFDSELVDNQHDNQQVGWSSVPKLPDDRTREFFNKRIDMYGHHFQKQNTKDQVLVLLSELETVYVKVSVSATYHSEAFCCVKFRHFTQTHVQ